MRVDALEHLRAHVAELANPWNQEVRRRQWDEDAGEWVTRVDQIRHPSLLSQFTDVRRAADDATGAGKGAGPRATGRLQVMDAERSIVDGTERHPGVRDLALQFGAPLSKATDTRAALLWLSWRATALDTNDVRGLEASAREWRSQARIALGYDDAPHEPQVPCMRCGQFGTVRFTAEPLKAWCTATLDDGSRCGAEWDAVTIGVFGQWCRTWEESSNADGDPAGGEKEA